MPAPQAALALQAIQTMQQQQQQRKQQEKIEKQQQGARTTSQLAKARANIKITRKAMLGRKGWKTIFEPRFWLLYISQITLANFYPIFIATIITGIFLMVILFGTVSACYSLYFLKAVISVIVNVPLTIANALWFGVHAITQAIYFGFLTIINTMQHFFLSPLIDTINAITGVFGIEAITFIPLGEGAPVQMQPADAFAYLSPNPVEWGDWNSAVSFIWIKCGADPYVSGESVYVMGQSGASLSFPKYNYDGIADWIWSPLATRADSISYDWTSWYKDSTGTWFEVFSDIGSKIVNWIVDKIGSVTDVFSNAINILQDVIRI